MTRQLGISDAAAYQRLRLHSLSTDPCCFLSALHVEAAYPSELFAQKLLRVIQPPVFGIYGRFAGDSLIATLQLASSYLVKKSHIATLNELYVHPQYRRQSIAASLITHCLDLLRQQTTIEQVNINVNSGNTPAISLYQKLGFRHLLTHPKAVKELDGTYQDELLLFLNLQ